MKVYRLTKEKYKKDLSGSGAKISGGRWNSKGWAMFYTSESRSLCTAEIAVHLPLGNIPLDYVLLTLEIPDTVEIPELKITSLPTDWKSLPYSNSTQLIGNHFLGENKFIVMKVPSAVASGDFNYLINPTHQLISKIKILKAETFEFDKRLFIK